MSFTDNYLKLRKKREEEDEQEKKQSKGNSFTEEYSRLKSQQEDDDIAPVVDNSYKNHFGLVTQALTSGGNTTLPDEDSPEYKAQQLLLDMKFILGEAADPIVRAGKSQTLVKSGAFSDGYDFGDVTLSILGTAGDAALEAAKGFGKVGEGLGKGIALGAAQVGDWFGADDWAEGVRDRAQTNFIDEWTEGLDSGLEKYSVLGSTTDAILQGVGQVGAVAATGGAAGSLGASASGVTAVTTGTTFLNSFGHSTSEAYQNGATDEEAYTYGLTSATVETVSELIFGGMGKAVNAVGFSKGLSSLDDMAAKAASKYFKSETGKNVVQWAIKSGFEGLEEVGAGFGQAVAKKLTYMSEEDFGKILQDENLFEQFFVGAMTSGIMQSGVIPGTQSGSLIESNKTGRDFVSGLSSNEQAVVDKVFKDELAKAEENGKVTNKQKNEIYNKVLKRMERGYISTDTIGEVLGGDSYKSYKEAIDSENALKEQQKELKAEYDTLYKMKGGEKSDEMIDRQADLKKQIEEIQAKLDDPQRNALKVQLGNAVRELTKNDKLSESYFEQDRKFQSYQADFSKYKGAKYEDAAKKTIENAIKAGANNTNAVHDIVDFAAKIAGDTGKAYDFQSNEQSKADFIERQTKLIEELEKQANRNDAQNKKLAELKDILEKVLSGKTKVNGNITANGIVLNLEAGKPLNRVVGHEVTHIFEPEKGKSSKEYTALKDALYKLAKAKKIDVDQKLAEYKLLYEGLDADAEAEMIADMVGDFLFDDTDFAYNLATENRNVFQKIWDEVKHLYKIATAGSKEARELARVQKAFEDAYRAIGTKNTAKSRGVKYSITEPFVDLNGNRFENAVLLDTDFFDGISPRNWGEKLRTLVNERSSENPFILPVTDENGNTTMLQFASTTDRVKKDGGAQHRVLDELSMTTDNISKLAVVHIDEIASVSEESSPYHTAENSHQWLDKNGWLHRNANVINQKNGNIYNLTLDIAKAADGRTILYATNGKIKKVGNAEVNSLKIKGSGQNSNFDDNVAQKNSDVKKQYSVSDQNIKDIHTGYASDEYYYTMSYTQDGKEVATLDYGVYEGKPNVKMIEVDPEYRRKGIATKLLQELQNKYPDTEIDFGMSTPDGTKLLESITYDVTDEAVVADRQKLKDLQAELDDLEAKIGAFDELFDNGTITEAQRAKFEALGDRWDEVYHSINELAPTLRGKKATKTFVKTDTKYSISDSEVDKTYFDAVTNGDWETAERMVEEAAKAAGYTKAVYHGTESRFTVFDTDEESTTRPQHAWMADYPDGTIFLAEDYDVADGYGDRVMWLYLDTTDMKVFEEPDMYAHRAMDDKYGYEVYNYPVIAVKGKDMTIYATLDNTAVKSADTLTIDDDGAIIPLSERFKHSEPDIRYSLSDSDGRQLSKGQQEYFKNSKAVDENGNLKVVYHGTRNADFTVFKRNATYFTDNKEMADSYSPNGDMYEGYVNITKPYEIDAKGEKWSKIPIDDATRNFLQEYGASVFKEGGKWRTSPADIVSAIEEAVDNGDMDYDGIIIKNIDDTGSYYKDKDSHLATDYIVFNSNQFKNADNKAPTSDPDIRFSLSNSVEETKDLVALHNLTADKLSKSLELGGLPMPSLAITKADIPHSNFGEITLIFGRDTIDPKVNKKNKAYSADAWTPVFPRVEYEADSEVASRVSKKLRELGGKVDDIFKRDVNRVSYDFDDLLNRNGGEEGLIQRVMDNDGLKAAYLEDIGKHIEAVTTQKKAEMGFNPAAADKYQKTMDILGVTTAEEIDKVNLKDAMDNHGEELEAVYSGASKSALRMARWLGVVKSYIESKDAAPVYETVVDSNATRKAVDDALDAEGYEAWVRNLFSGIEKDSGIYNNKDIFTPSGNRRSFKQTHLPVTLENIVKAMASQNAGNAKNVSGFNGIKTLRAATAETFKSVDEMHQRKGRLQNKTQEEVDALNDALQTRLFKVMEKIDNESGQIGSDNPYIRLDSIGDILTEIGESGKYGIADIQRVFKEYSRNISDDTAMEAKQLLYDVAQMPVNIFEAKPQRVVSFDEAKVFVIPRNADVKLKQELLNRGYSIAEYDPDVEGDRQKVVNQFEEYKFSLSDSHKGFTPIRAGEFFGKDFRVQKPAQDDVAPIVEKDVNIREENANVAPVVGAENAATMFPDDIAPAQTLDDLMAEAQDIMGAMESYEAVGDTAKVEQLLTEYEDIMKRVGQMQQADTERVNSLDDADAPPETERHYDRQEDTSPIEKKDIADIANEAKTTLALRSHQMADFRNLIEEYSKSDNQSRERLFKDIRDNFGTYKERISEPTISDAKKYLRATKLYLSDTIIGDIADFDAFKKRNRRKVILSANGGLPVDIAYQELNSLYPHLFPESISNPTDQLLQMVDVANMSGITWNETPIADSTLWEVANDIADNVSELKRLQKEAMANAFDIEAFDNLVAHGDQYAPPVDGDIAPIVEESPVDEDIAPVAYEASKPNREPIAAKETSAEERITRKGLHQGIVDNMKSAFAKRGFDFDKVLKNAKNLSTFATVDNTPQRVMEKALGYKEGGVLADLTVNQVAQNETEGIKWLNSYTDRKNGVLAQISKQYSIKPGSKESAAAQMYAEGFYVDEKNNIVQYGDAELAKDFPDVKVQRNIKGLAGDPRIRQIYDDTLAMINESRTRNAYPEIPRLDNYFLHFRAMEDTFSRLGLPFNPNDIRAKDLPTDLNGVTADLKPGQPYFASAMHRTGKRTSFDLLGGLEKYLSSAKNQIYHIDDIQTLRALRNYVADTYGQANGLEGLDALTEEEAQDRIEKVYNSHLSTFAKFLNEEANVLAGKTALIDRGLEGIIGRRGITFLDTVNRQVGSNMVGFNVSSSLTNFLPVVQTFAKSNKADFVKAFGQTVANKVGSIFGRSDGFSENSPVVIRRKGADRFYRTPFQKAGDAGYVFMGAVDNISTELIARTKYNELTRKGMDSQKAHYETDKWVSRVMGDRSIGQQPHLYNSKMLGLFTKFQLEVRNQLDSQFYDTIQEAKVSNEDIQNGLARNAKTAAKVASTFLQLAVAQHLFGKAFESVAGYNPAFDIIEVLLKTFGWDDDEESEDTALDNIEQGFLALLEDLPYTSTLTGGRIPIESALPIEQFVKGEDKYGNEKSRWETLGEIAPYYILPGGYGQIKKTYQGLSMFDEDHPIAGSYTDSGNLRFPVEDTLGNRVQAGIFGQWASENAQDYFDNERSPLNEKQIQEFIDVDLTIQDYWEYREGLSGLKTLAEKADYIDSLDLTDEQKNVLINNIADRKEDIDMSDYGNYSSFEEFDYATKNPEKYNFLTENGVAYDDYKNGSDEFKDAWSWAYENPEKYTLSQAISSDLVAYRKYTSELYDIRADKDSNGKTISGSAKEKKIEYINNLDLEYGEKIILFKSLYEADDTYNMEIIEYLNGREDISYEQMETILKELGFNVDSQGNITWD